jgi:ADP-ribose pyrophosphatase YjhB (NUDIX family)
LKQTGKPEVVVVTGASAGLGRAIVRAFAREGYHVGLIARGRDGLEAARREVEEESGLKVRIAGLVGVLDRVTRDAEGRVRYHWVLVDYLAFPESNETITAGSDAAEVRWVTIDEVDRLPITDGLVDMIRRAAALGGGGGA